MSGDKEVALVRSPPGFVSGVESYSSHIPPHGAWEHQQTPSALNLRTATVTKITSPGENRSIRPKNGRKNQAKRSKAVVNDMSDEDYDGPCGCDGWARARQLEHDMDQLHKLHDSVLKGLHQQLDEMKQKNRDVTFQLLMGPYASAVTVNAPISPESDITSPKESKKARSVAQAYDESDQVETNTVQSKERKGKSGDPRQMKSLNVEILEEEIVELKKQLEDEKANNQFLKNKIKDSKRQMHNEVGSYPQSQQPTKARLVQPLSVVMQDELRNQESKVSHITNGLSTKFPRLPNISKQKQNQEPSEVQELKQQKQSPRSHQSHDRNSPNQNTKKKNTTLPSISQQGNLTNISEPPIKLNEEETIDYGISRGNEEHQNQKTKHKGKGKSKKNTSKMSAQSLQAQGEQVQLKPNPKAGPSYSEVQKSDSFTENRSNFKSDKPINPNPEVSKRQKDIQTNSQQECTRLRSSGSLTRSQGRSRGGINQPSRDSSTSGRSTAPQSTTTSSPRKETRASSSKRNQSQAVTSANKENLPKCSKKLLDNLTLSSTSLKESTEVASNSSAQSNPGKQKYKSRSQRKKNKSKKENQLEAQPNSTDQ